MFGTLLAITTPYTTTACTFGALNTNDWFGINVLLAEAAIMIAAVVYSLSGLLPNPQRERLKGLSRTEIFQSLLNIVIVIILLAMASSFCNIGQAYVGAGTANQYHDPMQFSSAYLGNLLFNQSLNVYSSLYSKSIQLTVDSDIVSNLAGFITQFINSLLPSKLIQLDPSPSIGTVFYDIAVLVTGQSQFVVIIFGVLFFFYFMIPIIEATALTVVVPLALLVRGLPFTGPKLRETANDFFAIAIAFYFIFPMTILMNYSVVAWIHTPCTATVTYCNPYTTYLNNQQGFYSSGDPTASSIFQNAQPAFGWPSLPVNWYSSLSNGDGGVSSVFFSMWNSIFHAPQFIFAASSTVAMLFFESIFLLALDMTITVGFAMGLTQALNHIRDTLGFEGFW